MTKFTLDLSQEPPEDVITRLSELKDEDIVYDDDSPDISKILDIEVENK